MKMLENNSGREIGDPDYWKDVQEFEGVRLNAHRSIVRDFDDGTFIFPTSLWAKYVEIHSVVVKRARGEVDEAEYGTCWQGKYERHTDMVSAIWYQDEQDQDA